MIQPAVINISSSRQECWLGKDLVWDSIRRMSLSWNGVRDSALCSIFCRGNKGALEMYIGCTECTLNVSWQYRDPVI